jgi:hypothetical protein
MKRLIIAALALFLVVGLQPQAARAQSQPQSSWNNLLYWLSHGQDYRLMYSGWAVGAASGAVSYWGTQKHGNPGVKHMSYGTAYGVTTAGCVVIYPIVATIWVNRPLTPREAYTGMADCVVPFIGGWIVDAILPHDAWTDGTPVKPVRQAKK